MNTFNDQLLIKIGEMSASIEASRHDSNNRFNTLLESVSVNKSEFEDFKKEVLAEFKVMNKFIDQLKVVIGVIGVFATPASLLAIIQIVLLFNK